MAFFAEGRKNTLGLIDEFLVLSAISILFCNLFSNYLFKVESKYFFNDFYH